MLLPSDHWPYWRGTAMAVDPTLSIYLIFNYFSSPTTRIYDKIPKPISVLFHFLHRDEKHGGASLKSASNLKIFELMILADWLLGGLRLTTTIRRSFRLFVLLFWLICKSEECFSYGNNDGNSFLGWHRCDWTPKEFRWTYRRHHQLSW